jgi:hypothetical protein
MVKNNDKLKWKVMSYVGIGSKANSLKALMYRSKNSVGD